MKEMPFYVSDNYFFFAWLWPKLLNCHLYYQLYLMDCLHTCIYMQSKNMADTNVWLGNFSWNFSSSTSRWNFFIKTIIGECLRITWLTSGDSESFLCNSLSPMSRLFMTFYCSGSFGNIALDTGAQWFIKVLKQFYFALADSWLHPTGLWIIKYFPWTSSIKIKLNLRI